MSRSLSADHLAAMLAGKAARDAENGERRDREQALRLAWSGRDAALTAQIMAHERDHGVQTARELRAERIANVHELHKRVGSWREAWRGE